MDEDAVKYDKIILAELISQLNQQGELLRVERCTARIKPIRNFDTPIPASYCLNGIRTHEYFDVAVNRSGGYIQFAGQIFTGIMPVTKQFSQQILATFGCTHALTPLSFLPMTNCREIT